MKLDINRIAVTRDGRRFKLLCVDRPADYPVAGYDLVSGGIAVWTTEGKASKYAPVGNRIDIVSQEPIDIVSQEPIDTSQAARPKIDIKKPVKTRDGQEATIITTDGRASYKGEPCPLMGYIGGGTDLRMWTDTGRNPITPDADLVQENEVWVVIRHNGCPGVFSGPDAERAAKANGDHRARIRVPYVIGQFD